MTQGIKRIEQLFEVRTPKNPAVIAPFDGQVSVYNSGNYIKLKIVGEQEKKPYLVKPGYTIVVKEGEVLRKGAEYAVKGKSKLKVDEE
jgi:DNA-directed RNA polymerase subunit beta'